MIINYNKFREHIKKFEGLDNEASTNVDERALFLIKMALKFITTRMPFWVTFISKMRIAESKSVKTMATDGKSIVYNPDFVNNLSGGKRDVIFILIHEILHNANLHFVRQNGRNSTLWNVAADYAINILISDMIENDASLKSSLSPVPSDILLDPKYRDMSAEVIYEILKQEIIDKTGKDPDEQGDGQDGDGQDGDGQDGDGQDGDGQDGDGQGKSKGKGKGKGSNGQGEEDGEGEVGNKSNGKGKNLQPGTPGHDVKKAGELDDVGETVYEGDPDLKTTKTSSETVEKWKKIRIEAGSKKGAFGEMSANLRRWIDKITETRLEWKEILRKFVKDRVGDTYKMKNFNRRLINRGVYVPGIKRDLDLGIKHAVISFDTSGSVGDKELSIYANELNNIFKSYKIESVDVIWCDADVKFTQRFDKRNKFSPDKLKPAGGGGTNLAPPFAWVEENLLKRNIVPSIFIYFTDGDGSFPKKENYKISRYVNNVLWVIATSTSYGKKINPPFGYYIHMDLSDI